MAVLHRKEEKIQAVLGRLPKKYSPDDFVAMFIKLYSKDWGKIKSAYIKASQDKEPNTVIHMPKPDLYLKQVLEIFLTQKPTPTALPKEIESKPIVAKEIESKPIAAKVAKSKATVKKTEKQEESIPVVKKTSTKATKSKTPVKAFELAEPIAVVKKAKASTKKKVD